MPRVEFDMETPLPPEKIVSMLTDFSERRPDVWSSLWRGAYQVYSIGETTAEVREGNKSPKICPRERYDWSKPGVVRWEVLESNFCKPGSYVEARSSRRPEKAADCMSSGSALPRHSRPASC
jgi:hypothetical protein